MADKVATDFISSMKAKGRKALDWFKKIVTKTQRAAAPASFGRREILNDRKIMVENILMVFISFRIIFILICFTI